ncbi:MAG: thermonuclease family protein [Burkholderiales bacterium]
MVFFLLFLSGGLAFADTLQGEVVEVVDGDTLSVSEGENVRHTVKLAGIDAPEGSQAHGKESRQHLSEMALGRTVSIEYCAVDALKRILGTVVLDDKDLGLEQIEAGFAWHYKYSRHEQSDEQRRVYSEAQSLARTQRLGLWQDPAPETPWGYRARQNSSMQPMKVPSALYCREIKENLVQCDNGTTYRTEGDVTYASDGKTYRHQGDTIYGSDGITYQRKGDYIYGSDGTICRERGEQVYCFEPP